jgi:hypothetical protein
VIAQAECYKRYTETLGQKLPVLPFWEIGKPAKTDDRREPGPFQSCARTLKAPLTALPGWWLTVTPAAPSIGNFAFTNGSRPDGLGDHTQQGSGYAEVHHNT